jgi:hypothetical protein
MMQRSKVGGMLFDVWNHPALGRLVAALVMNLLSPGELPEDSNWRRAFFNFGVPTLPPRLILDVLAETGRES